MHGRVKVRTTEEEKKRKELERQAKLKVFNNVMNKINIKRSNKEYDAEMLELTSKLLTSNPDIYTLWNIRRTVLMEILQEKSDQEELSKLYDAELDLTEYCLKSNPKSYCAWYQREWILTTRSDPDWEKELKLCNIYLKLDERNFHTWDYRRFVVSKCDISLEEEFQYTTEKIHENFSNYSAWHYRSKMLVSLHPDMKGGRPIEDRHHKSELQLVVNAAFTDPDDTSAWFYQRWLLGAVKKVITVVACSITSSKATIAFNHPVSKEYLLSSLSINIGDRALKGKWNSCSGNAFDVLWILEHDYIIEMDSSAQVKHILNGDEQTIDCRLHAGRYIGKGEINFVKRYSEPVVEELKSQLASCEQLLRLEPDSKWTLLTTTVLQHCIDPINNHEKIIKNLMKLKDLDKLRSGYYDDLASKWLIESYLRQLYSSQECLESAKPAMLNKITMLYHPQYFSIFKEVDLSNQSITSKALVNLIYLQACERLKLDNNNISTMKSFPRLENIRELSIQGNNLLDSEVETLKNKLPANCVINL